MVELTKSHERYDILMARGDTKTSPITDNLAIMFKSIATKLSSSNHFTYKSDADQEDCISSAVLDCLKYWDSFLREPLPVVDEDGHLVTDEDGNIVEKPVKFSPDLMIPVMQAVTDEDGKPIKDSNKKPVKIVQFDEDGRVKMKKPNPFAYFTSVCTNGLAKGWGALGYTDLPFAKRVYISDSIYSI